jgi:ATP-binding protein involved in chromosome partitioning
MSITEKMAGSASKKDTDSALLDRNLRESLSSIKHKFMVVSSQGGVGKTSVIVNAAVALSKRRVKVGLMDVNSRGPDIHRMLGLEPAGAGTSDNRLIPVQYSNSLKVASIASAMQEPDGTGAWGMPLKTSDMRRFISSVKWGSLDYLFIDTPSGPDDALLMIIRSIPDVKTIVVTAANKVSAERAKNMINFFRKEEIPIFGWIENMRGFFCQHCGEPLELFSSGSGSRAIFLGDIPLLGRIPIDPHLAESAAVGKPLMARYPESEVAQGCNLIAEKILEDGEIILNEDKPETIGGL